MSTATASAGSSPTDAVSAVRDGDGRYWFDVAELERVPAPPARPGRPAIGAAVEVRLPPALLAQVDALACNEKVPRAEVVRRLLAKALAS